MNECIEMKSKRRRTTQTSMPSNWIESVLKGVPRILHQESDIISLLRLDLECSNVNNEHLSNILEAMQTSQRSMQARIDQLEEEVKVLRVRQALDSCAGLRDMKELEVKHRPGGILNIIGCLEDCGKTADELQKASRNV